jgi:ribosomal RNA-processing protein 12
MELATTKLLPILFKLLTESCKTSSDVSDKMDIDDESNVPRQSRQDGQQTSAVSDAISSLACLAPTSFLHGVCQKLIHRLVEEIQSEECDKEKICSYLVLSEALVVSEVLEETNISFLYRALKPFLRTDEYGARVQKRAYKVLAAICQHHHSFAADTDRLKELASLLSGSIMTSQVGARCMRLKCLNLIIEGFNEENKRNLVSCGMSNFASLRTLLMIFLFRRTSSRTLLARSYYASRTRTRRAETGPTSF